MWAALACCSAITAVASGAGPLQTEIEELIRAKHMAGATVGVVVIDARDGRVLADVRGDKAFMPASNMKLLTTGAALMVLGPDYAFRTELLLENTSLTIRGAGDPALGDPDILRLSDPRMSSTDLVNTLAGAVAKSGATTLTQILVDDRVFDREFLHPAWNAANFEETYSAEVSGLNFHANTVWAFPRPSPSGSGSLPTCETEPSAPWLRVDCSKAKTVTKGKNSFWIARAASNSTCYLQAGRVLRDPVIADGFACNAFSLRGDVRASSSAPTAVNVRHSPAFFGHLLASAIAARGVTLTGTPAAPGLPGGVRLLEPHEPAPDGRVIAVVSTPIDDIVTHCNAESQNLYAECLLKRIGHEVTGEPGSWSNGGAVLRMLVSQELGPEAAAATVVSDGSGLSRDNRVTPMTLARWLQVCAGKEWGAQFVESLAAPGIGTLEKRFRDKVLTNEVRAKSGYINGVRSLSGYVTDDDTGERLVFSILINDLPNVSNDATNNARQLHEEIVDLLDDTLVRRVSGRRLGG